MNVTDTPPTDAPDPDDVGDAAALDFEADLTEDEANRVGSAAARPEHTVPLRLALALAARSSAELLERLEAPREAAEHYLGAVDMIERALGQNEAERQMLEAGKARAMVMAAKAIERVET